MRPFLFFILCITLGQTTKAQTPTREITKITGDLYRFQNNAHYAVFLVTNEGVIITDPIDSEASKWLKDEIKKRFNQPIKYVVYSHHHDDHITGGEVFEDAIFVGHELTKKNIQDKKMQVPLPEETFTEKKTISLGGKKVELIYPGKSHSEDCIAIFFPEEKTVFAVDFISVDRLPYRTLNNAYVKDWITAIKTVEKLDFDTMVPGHGKVGNKKDVAAHRIYLEALYKQVKKAFDKGQSLTAMKERIRLESYKDMGQYDNWREMNIEGVYNFLVSKEKH